MREELQIAKDCLWFVPGVIVLAGRLLGALLVVGSLVVSGLSVACLQSGDGPLVDLNAGPAVPAPLEHSVPDQDSAPEAGTLVFAVAAVNSSRSSFSPYQELATYLARELGLTPKFVGNRTYAEINGMIRFKEATFAAVCAAPYVYGHDDFGMELLVAPVIDGVMTYHSYLIVAEDSDITGWPALRGKTFAFTDPLSNSGRLVPLYELSTRGETPESFFDRFIFTYSHENSIEAVASGLVDAAAVDSAVYRSAARHGRTEGTRVIWESPAFPISPFVVHPELDPELKAALRGLLLGLHKQPEGREILAKLEIDRFDEISDDAYDPIREMVHALARGDR